MTPANLVTSARIALIPLFVAFMYSDGARSLPGSVNGPGTWLAFVVFVLAATTDSLDGYLARRYNDVTRLGQFLDPLADKLLIGAGLFTLVVFRGFPIWAAIVIVTREVAVSVVRSVGARRGKAMPASLPGKIKTAIQIPMVLVWLLPRVGAIRPVQDVFVYAAVILTILSGILFLKRSRSLLVDESAPL